MTIRQTLASLNERFWSLILPLVVVLAGFTLCVHEVSFVSAIRNLVFDTYQRIAPRQRTGESQVKIIDIDDESLAKIGQWPWPRTTLATISQKLAEAGAVAVGYDILFSESDRLSPEEIIRRLPETPERDAISAEFAKNGNPNDEVFAIALAKMPSVLGFISTPQKTGVAPPKIGIAFSGTDPRAWLPHSQGAILPIKVLSYVVGLGSLVFIPDRDLIVRKVNLLFNVGEDAADGVIVPSLDAALLRDAQGASTMIVKSSDGSGNEAFGTPSGITEIKIGALSIPTDRTGAVRIYFARNDPGRRIPAWKLVSDIDLRDELNGKIVLVGSSATALADIRSTPIEAVVPGIDIHAELIENLLEGVQLARPDYSYGLESVVLLIGSLIAFLLSRIARPIFATFGILAISIGLWVASFQAFREAGLLFDPVIPVSTLLAVFGVAILIQYRQTDRAKREIRGAFSRYVSPGVIANLEKNPMQLRLGGETRNVSIMFCDARDFTTRSESLDAAGVVHFLNSLHTPLTAHVLDTSGTIDKYIGDGLMAFWNAPHHVPDHASKSCSAALRMIQSIPEIDARLKEEALAEGRRHVPLAIGIGINTGPSFVGNMGSDQRFDYSVVGDTVNVAARLESATKEYGVDIIVSAETAAEAPDFVFVELEGLSLKGKAAPVQALALHGPKPAGGDAELARFLALHRDALEAVRQRSPDAEALIDKAALHPCAQSYAKLYDLWRARARRAQKSAEMLKL